MNSTRSNCRNQLRVVSPPLNKSWCAGDDWLPPPNQRRGDLAKLTSYVHQEDVEHLPWTAEYGLRRGDFSGNAQVPEAAGVATRLGAGWRLVELSVEVVS